MCKVLTLAWSITRAKSRRLHSKCLRVAEPMSSIDHCVTTLGSSLSDGRRKAVSWRSSGEVIEEAGKGNALFTMIEKRIAITGFSECHVAVGFLRRKHFLVIWISFSRSSPDRIVIPIVFADSRECLLTWTLGCKVSRKLCKFTSFLPFYQTVTSFCF